MKRIDIKYLKLQFRVEIYRKNGSEFQDFFERIIVKVHPDFQKIQPYGKEGDSGNDGYIKKSGIYFQVYAPIDSTIKKATAAKKLKNDFEKLKLVWDEISTIKEYFFVFNDKYTGSISKLEKVLVQLEKENPKIKFKLFLADNLEQLFLKLDDEAILDIGFDVNLTTATKNAYEYLENVETELDRENGEFAIKNLEYIKDIINNFNNENLKLEYEILECKCLQKLERVNEAKSKYDNIIARYPGDSRALLYISEIYLGNNDFDENLKLLQSATRIDPNFWLLKFENLIRKYYLEEDVDLTNIDEKQFTDDPKIQSNFYRLYAHFLADKGNITKAESFIERAITLNPNKLNNYYTKLFIIEKNIYSEQNIPAFDKLQSLLSEINLTEDKIAEFGGTGPRNKAILNLKKLNIFRLNEDYENFIILSKETIDLIFDCYLNNQIDEILTGLLSYVLLPDDDYERILAYIKKSSYHVSENLSKVIILQFNGSDNRIEIGKKFFIEIDKKGYIDFITYLKNKEYDNILKFLENDYEFAVNIASALTNFSELRRKIVDFLPGDYSQQKTKLLLSIYTDENNTDEAFKIIQSMDRTQLGYLEYKQILDIELKKQAWDDAIKTLDKLLKHEKNKKISFKLNLYLFNAFIHLENYSKATQIGNIILESEFKGNNLDIKNKEILLAQTIIAHMMKSEFELAKQLLEKYPLENASFDFKVKLETDIYIRNNEPQKALTALIEGIKIRKFLSATEYAKLFPLVAIKIGNLITFDLASQEIIKENSFVKIKNKTRWYFIGNGDELDAIKIPSENDLYAAFIGKKITDKIIKENRFAMQKTEDTIELIYSIEQYVFWQIQQNFHELSQEQIIDGVQVIAIPKKDETIDLTNLISFLEDIHKRRKPFYELYTKSIMPFAILAAYEGGLLEAIGYLLNENLGYINCSTGFSDELKQQKRIAENIINNKLAFYLDGTSAFILSEMNLFSIIADYIPNVKVPQSVIALLHKIILSLQKTPGQVGYMKYTQGILSIQAVEKEKRDSIILNLSNSINYLESRSDYITALSKVNKSNCFSEQKIPAELCDACILAQKEEIAILTEDFRYLQMNELETGKKVPEYFSSFILFRILYEMKIITFEDYLEFFYHLSSYRFRFLGLSSDDLIKAVFGDLKIKHVKPDNLRKFNFRLTLSEEYGVSFETATIVVVQFLLFVLTNDIILPEYVDKIFIELIELFPSQIDKKDFSQILFNICVNAINMNKSKFIITPKNRVTEGKLNKIKKIIEIYKFKKQLWLPDKK